MLGSGFEVDQQPNKDATTLARSSPTLIIHPLKTVFLSLCRCLEELAPFVDVAKWDAGVNNECEDLELLLGTDAAVMEYDYTNKIPLGNSARKIGNTKQKKKRRHMLDTRKIRPANYAKVHVLPKIMYCPRL